MRIPSFHVSLQPLKRVRHVRTTVYDTLNSYGAPRVINCTNSAKIHDLNAGIRGACACPAVPLQARLIGTGAAPVTEVAFYPLNPALSCTPGVRGVPKLIPNKQLSSAISVQPGVSHVTTHILTAFRCDISQLHPPTFH